MRLLGRERALRSRLREIITVFVKYGFGDITDRLKMGHYLAFGLKFFTPKPSFLLTPLNRYERLRLACAELGPTFIKMGQILSTRPDLIPPELAQELAKLQDTAPPFSFEEAKKAIEEDLGPLSSTFASFTEEPFAAASIAQVHRAKLITGEEVAVKIRRPGIKKMVEEDILILYELARLLERHFKGAAFSRPTQIVDEFARTIREELTFTVEAAQAERFSQMFQGRKEVRIPRIFQTATSERILTMEYLEGIKISDIDALDHQGFDRKLIADRGTEILLEQIFVHGFFHADPHPGNILVLPHHVLCFLDFGMMGYLRQEDKDTLMEALIAFARRDVRALTRAVLTTVDYDEEPDEHSLERDVHSFMSVHLYRPLKHIRIAEIMRDLLNITNRHGIRLRSNYFFMLKALSQLESIGLYLDPDFDLLSRIQPYVEKLTRRKGPERLIQEATELVTPLITLPADLRQVLQLINKGKMSFSVEQKNLEETVQELNRATNRLVMALILAAIIISSSIILTTSGQTIIGAIGFIVAGILGLGLLISILRSGIF